MSSVMQVEGAAYNVRGVMLLCNCEYYSRMGWCAHIHEAIQTGDDLPRTSTGIQEPLDNSVIVPIFKSPSLSVPVWLSHPHAIMQDLREAKVVWHARDADGSTEPHSASIGFIGMNQGRRALRSLTVEWLISMFYQYHHKDGTWGCAAPQHYKGTGWYERVDENMVDGLPSNQLLTDVMELIATGWCRSCHMNDGVPDI